MLTRLQVRGFKNLVEVDVSFGPLTCIVGPNGVGKSNLFEAITWLAELADKPFAEARLAMRGGRDPARLFDAHGEGRMELVAEMLLPITGKDEYGRAITSHANHVRYSLTLGLAPLDRDGRRRIVLEHERLEQVEGLATEQLGFASTEWLDTVITYSSVEPRAFVVTQDDSVLAVEQDDPPPIDRRPLGRTVLSTLGRAEDGPTAVLARQEMRRWRWLHLDPAALRQPDDLHRPVRLDANGSGYVASLYRLANQAGDGIYQQVANRLAELVDGVGSLRVERDEARQLLELRLAGLDGSEWPAEVLSDGTARFLALAVLEADEQAGTFCIEEPENGVHPQRLAALVDLLYDIALDLDHPIGDGNPWRQVILGSHSSALAERIGADDLLLARSRPRQAVRGPGGALVLECLEGGWRQAIGMPTVAPGRALTFLRAASPPSRRDGIGTVADRLNGTAGPGDRP